MLETVRRVPGRERHFCCSKRQTKAEGADPGLPESEVTAPTSLRSGVVTVKVMRPPTEAGAGALPLSTSGRVGRARSSPLGPRR